MQYVKEVLVALACWTFVFLCYIRHKSKYQLLCDLKPQGVTLQHYKPACRSAKLPTLVLGSKVCFYNKQTNSKSNFYLKLKFLYNFHQISNAEEHLQPSKPAMTIITPRRPTAVIGWINLLTPPWPLWPICRPSVGCALSWDRASVQSEWGWW